MENRFKELLEKCMDYIDDCQENNKETLKIFREIGFTNDDLEEMNFSYLLEE